MVREILKQLNLAEPDFLETLTVRETLRRMSVYLCLVPDDLPDALIINQTCERVVTMLKDCLKHEDNEAVPPAATQSSTPTKQKATNGPSAVSTATSASKDIARAWEILQNQSKVKPECIDSLARLLDDLGIDSVDSLNDIDKADYHLIAQMLKKAGANGFLKALNLQASQT